MTRTNEAGVVHLLDRPRWREAARRHRSGSQLLGYQLGALPSLSVSASMAKSADFLPQRCYTQPKYTPEGARRAATIL